MNQALAQCSEAKGIDDVITRWNFQLQSLRSVENPTNAIKVNILMLESARKSTLETRESLLKQAYNNLKSYFGDEWVIAEVNKPSTELDQSST